MKWGKDWLYALIYRDVENLWTRVVIEGKGAFGPSPEYLLISQFADLHVESLDEAVPSMLTCYFKTPVLNQWIFDSFGLRINSQVHSVNRKTNSERGMFYQVGTVGFHISSDRKLVVIQYTVGPRYGELRVFKVEGQGCRGKLVGHPDFILCRT